MRALLVGLAFAFAGLAADVTGKWALSTDTGAAHSDTELDLKQDGTKLTGTYRGTGGESPLRGSVKGDAIEFTVTVGRSKMTFRGTVAGDSMSGDMSIPHVDEGRWTARKK